MNTITCKLKIIWIKISSKRNSLKKQEEMKESSYENRTHSGTKKKN